MSKVKDLGLAAEGHKELLWARENMPVLAQIRKEFEEKLPLKGLKIGTCLHLEKKTGVLLEVLKAGGASVAACSCNPLTSDDRVSAALVEEGIEVFAWEGQNRQEYYENLNKVLDTKPDLVIDDGCDQIHLIHTKRKELLGKVVGGCEETTTGVTRLRAMEKEGELKFPVFSINDAYSKFLFDNRFGTGQSTVDAIMRATNKLIAGKIAVVVGYGWCGRGIASRLRGLGANVVVVEAGVSGEKKGESGYHRALEALYEGYAVMGMNDAAKIGDMFITATGGKSAISKEHFKLMRDKAILANAGHFNIEIDEQGLAELGTKKNMKDNIDEYLLKNGKRIYLLSEGRLVNLARPSGQGHPIEIMDGSFALQALGIALLAKNGKTMKQGVHEIPKEIDERVAELVLLAQGVKLEKLTEEQEKYLNEWREGT